MSPGARPGPAAQRGMALLLVVWLLALLAVIGGEFIASGRVRAAAEINKRDDLRGLALALAGYRLAVAALEEPINALSLDEDGVLLLHTADNAEGAKAAASGVQLGDGTCSWSVGDADGLVDLNEAARPVLANLLRACGLGPGAERDTIVDSILDWRDQNREHRLNGAEEDYYQGLDPPYSCKDGPFDVVQELLLVRGVTPELFAGGTTDGKAVPGLGDLLTTYKGEFNAATAPEAVLEASGRDRPARPAAPSRHYTIVATGVPTGGGAQRSLRAVVLREDLGGRRSFTLLYWSDNHIPTASEERGGR